MKETSLEMDSVSRDRIVNETDKNLFVEAGAGSGKTTMLVRRMVSIVEQGKDIGRICAITFTKAAASEFYERFQNALIERSNPSYIWKDNEGAGQLPKPTEITRERCRKALENIDLCFMGTIDSFCNMLLSEHPASARIPSESKIVSDADTSALYRQIFVDICDGRYGEKLAGMSREFRVIHRNAEEVFEKSIFMLMNNRNAGFEYSPCSGVNISVQFEKEKTVILRSLEYLINHPEIKCVDNKESAAAWDKLNLDLRALKRDWGSNASGVVGALKSVKKLRAVPSALNDLEKENISLLVPGGSKGKWLELDTNYLENVIKEIERIKYNISMTFLVSCIQTIENVMRDKGFLSFFDGLYYLRNMLRRDAAGDGSLIRYIQKRHSYFLIDEFQDTNPMQAEIFFYLSSENPVKNWYDCVPRQGSLFIVGDPKQSIYRFRSADVTSFLRVKKLFEKNGGEILSLSRNFRSVKPLCEYFNRVFSERMPEENDNQSRFEEIPLPAGECDELAGVYKYIAYIDKAQETHPDKTDPIRIAQIISSLVNNENFTITQKGEKRKLCYSDFMVITYGKKLLLPIMQQLDKDGIPAKVEGRVPFETNEALISVFQLYCAVVFPYDRKALCAALTGNILNFSKDDIIFFISKYGDLKYFDKDIVDVKDEKAVEIVKAIDLIRELSKRASSLSPAALFSLIIDSYQIFRFIAADNAEVLFYSLELLRSAEKSGIITSLFDGVDYIKTLLSGESDEERCLSLSENKNAVHMANLHKVKGLEAPVVIIAGAKAPVKTPSPDIRVSHNEEGCEGWVFSVRSERSESGAVIEYFSTSDFDEEKELEQAALLAENVRLEYVAATRAKNLLIICDSITSIRNNEKRSTRWASLIEDDTSDIFDLIGVNNDLPCNVTENVYASMLYDVSESQQVFNSRKSEEPSYFLKTPSHIRVTTKHDSDENISVTVAVDYENEDKEKNMLHSYPQLIGTMTHRLMEILVSSGNGYSEDEAAEIVLQEYEMPDNAEFASEIVQILRNICHTVKTGGYPQINGAPQDILSTLIGADECFCEIPFCYKEDKNIWHGIIDVIYKDSIGWHIIDYKTNADGSGLDSKYRSQLDAYKKAFETITGEKVTDALTYHIVI